MSWKRRKFEEFQARVRECVKGRLPSSGTAFFLYVYDPTEEKRCIENMTQFGASLEAVAHEVRVVWIGQLMARILADRGYDAENLREIEKDGRDSLLDPSSGLPRPRGGLADDLGKALLTGKHEVPALADGSQADVVFLLRTGALYPVAHVSQLLSRLENETRRTFCIAFPGSLDPRKEGVLRFLNEGVGRYYRATVVVG